MSNREIWYRRWMVISFWLSVLLLLLAAVAFGQFISGQMPLIFTFTFLIILSLNIVVTGNVQREIELIDYTRLMEIKKQELEEERQREENKRVYGKEEVTEYDWPIAREGWGTTDDTDEERAYKLKRNEDALTELEKRRGEV